MKIMLGGKYMLEQFHIHADLKQQLSTIHEKNKQEAGENAHLIGTKIYKASDNSIIRRCYYSTSSWQEHSIKRTNW